MGEARARENHLAPPRIRMMRCRQVIQVAALALETIDATKHEATMEEIEHGIRVKLKEHTLVVPYSNVAYWMLE